MTITAQTILTISASVVALVQLLKWAGIEGHAARLAVFIASGLGVALWAWSSSILLHRELAFDLFAVWIAVSLNAAGVFGFTRDVPPKVVLPDPPVQP